MSLHDENPTRTLDVVDVDGQKYWFHVKTRFPLPIPLYQGICPVRAEGGAAEINEISGVARSLSKPEIYQV